VASSGDEDLEVGPLRIPARELHFEAMRAGGPGGQNVNKVATQVQLRFSVRASPSLSNEQRARIEERLASRLTGEGELLIRATRHRTQLRNKADARERLAELLASALRREKRRRPTRPTRGARERRLQAKHRRGEIKRGRSESPE
jgi:ribosome-associated protein